jgi:hypothetical protein
MGKIWEKYGKIEKCVENRVFFVICHWLLCWYLLLVLLGLFVAIMPYYGGTARGEGAD